MRKICSSFDMWDIYIGDLIMRFDMWYCYIGDSIMRGGFNILFFLPEWDCSRNILYCGVNYEGLFQKLSTPEAKLIL